MLFSKQRSHHRIVDNIMDDKNAKLNRGRASGGRINLNRELIADILRRGYTKPAKPAAEKARRS